MFKRIVDAVEVIAAACAVVFVILLFVDKTPGTKVSSTPSPYATAAGDPAGSATTVAATAAGASADGARLYASNCAGCHGSTGGGGTGPKLSGGRTKIQFPDARTQVLFVSNGVGIMPAFNARLSQAEIAAIVNYTRTL